MIPTTTGSAKALSLVIPELKGRLDDGQLMAFESRYRGKDGADFPVEIRGEAFWEGGRRLTVALARDVTERTRAEAAMPQRACVEAGIGNHKQVTPSASATRMALRTPSS